jgi:hypothetical protein
MIRNGGTVRLGKFLIFIALGFIALGCTSEAEAACDPATTCNGNGSCNASGACVCETGFTGAACNQCAPNYYNYPNCTFCQASTTCQGRGTCSNTGACVCTAGFTGASCNQCAQDYYGFPNCTFCKASTTCNGKGTCGPTGGCDCAPGFTGANCNQCAANYYNYPNCTLCVASTTCNGHGVCNSTGSCVCSAGYTGASCNQCAAGYSGYPNCVLAQSGQTPTIQSISPGTAATTGGSKLVVIGSHFGTSGKITVGNKPCVVQSYGDLRVECSLPEGQGKDQSVILERAGSKSNIVKFSYLPPSITSISPSSGPSSGGTVLSITGANFGLNGSVTIGGKACAITAQTHARINCTLPPGNGTKLPVVVTVGGQTSTPEVFSYN